MANDVLFVKEVSLKNLSVENGQPVHQNGARPRVNPSRLVLSDSARTRRSLNYRWPPPF